MKTLLLMRHAKSSWKQKDLADQERPLNKRGWRDAPLMGHLLVDRELVPQRIVSSSAVRARETVEAIQGVLNEAGGFPGQVDYLDQLYMAEPPEYYSTLRAIPDDLERVMVVGHNPGLESLLQLLVNRIESLPTAVLAHIVLPIEHWNDLSQETTGELIEIWRPKEVRDEIEEEVKEKEKEKAASKEKSKAKEKEKPKEKAKGKKKDK